MGVCEVWPARLSDRSSAAARSRSTTSRQGRASCCSRSRIAPTPPANRSLLKRPSLWISACLDWAFGSRSRCSSRSDSSRSSSPEARGDQPAIGSRFRRTYGQLCNPYLGRLTGNYRARNRRAATGNPVATKVVTAHGPRSTASWRALPGATRSLRSLMCSKGPSSALIDTIGRLAGRCPSGEEAQRDVGLEKRQDRERHVAGCSRSCRLPAALAGDDEQEGGWLTSLTGRGRHGTGVWRFSGRVQYAREGMVG